MKWMGTKEGYAVKMLVNEQYIKDATTGELYQLQNMIEYELAYRESIKEKNK